MNRWVTLLSVLILAGFIAIGCSSSGGGSPVTPTADQEQTPELTTESNRAGSGARTNLLGYWDVYIDAGTGTVELVQNRHAMFTVNLTNILSKQVTGLNFKLINIIFGPEYIDVDIDIIVTHPFPGYPGFNGYDLRGIFMGDGSLTLEKGSLKYPELGVDQYMLPDPIDGAGGPDGYTRWFNFTEFSEADFPLFSFTAGKITTPDFAGTATLCPYRYYADGLQPEEDLWTWLNTHADQNGVFSQSVTNTRNFYIRFPTPEPGLQFSVAVIVSWEGLEPEYHPANCPEAIACEVADNSYVYYVDPTENGGNLNLDISLFGWEYQPSKIYIESTVLSGVASFDPAAIATGGGDHYSTYQVEIPADNVTGIEGQEYWVIAEYEGFDYTNDFGVPNLAGNDPMAAFFRYDLTVLDEIPAWIEVLVPNGGEEWVVGTDEEITWDSMNVSGTVFIDYSKDNFVDDINPVGINEMNDGSFTWEIPVDPSDTVRVRISSTGIPGLYDISDEDFSIVGPCDPDLDPPDTFIDYGCEDQPPDTTEITLGVSGIDPNDCTKPEDLTYEWRKAIDGGDFDEWHPDPGPELTITELSLGDWAIEVRTVDEADNKDPSPAECFFSIFDPCDPDLDPPDTFIDYGCEDQPADTTEITLGVSGIDPNDCTKPEDLTYEWRKAYDGGDFDEWQPGPGPELTITELFPGDWAIEVRAVDEADNKDPSPAECFFNIFDPCDPDLDPPDTFIDYGCEDQPPGTGYIILGVSGIDPNDCTSPEDLTYEWRKALNGGGFDPWHAPDTGPEIIIPSLIHGDWAVEVRAVDLAFNRDPSPAECFFNIPPPVLEGWARTWGGYGEDRVQGLAVDSSGNAYVTGRFDEYTDFDPGPGEDWHFSDGMADAFLSKFDANGDFQWARTWGTWVYMRCPGVAADDYGNVYVVGSFYGIVDFDPGPGVEERESEDYDAFLCKYNSTGDFIWVRTWGHYINQDSYTRCKDVALDSYGNIYTVGTFTQKVDFDPGPEGDVHEAHSKSDRFLSKFNPDGDFQWARTWGEYQFGSIDGYSMAITVDSSDYIYVAGDFDHTVDFDPGPGIDEQEAVHKLDVFLSKFNTNGDYQWARTWGGTDWDRGNGVATDATGNVYVTGSFELTVDFDPGSGVDERTSNGENDIFLSKFDTDGLHQGVMTWGGNSSDTGRDTDLYVSEAIYVTGNFAGTVDFDPSQGTDEFPSYGSGDMFLSKFDSSDDYLWARHVGAPEASVNPYGLSVDSLGYIYIAGYFEGTIDFNPGPGEDYHTSNGGDDCFLMRLPPYGYW